MTLGDLCAGRRDKPEKNEAKRGEALVREPWGTEMGNSGKMGKNKSEHH